MVKIEYLNSVENFFLNSYNISLNDSYGNYNVIEEN